MGLTVRLLAQARALHERHGVTSQLTGLAMIACGVLSLAIGVVLFVGRHPRETLRFTPPRLPVALPAPAVPELADTVPGHPVVPPIEPPVDDDEAPTARRTPRKAGFVQVRSDPWSYIDVAGHSYDSTQTIVLPPGEHTLHLVCGGCGAPQSTAVAVTVHPDQTEVVQVNWDDVDDD